MNPTPYGFDQFDAEDEDVKKTCEEYQNKDTEWLPVGDYINYMGDTAVTPCVKDVSKLTDGSEIGSWTDDPSDVDVTYQYAWVSSRKYRTVNGKKTVD